FGAVEPMKEAYRDQRALPWVESAITDVRDALRQLRRNKGFATAGILTLALGIGAAAAIYGVVDTALIRPLPFPDEARLVVVAESRPSRPEIPVNAMHVRSWQAGSGSFDAMALIRDIGMNLTEVGEPELLAGARVSPALFTMLGVPMALGRPFAPEEDVVGRDH